MVVDASMKIMDIVARQDFFKFETERLTYDFSFIYFRWPGSNHDQSIFNFSQLKIRLEDGEFGNSVLLGDAGYSCKNYLLTPLANAVSPAEIKYQKAFVQTRLIVERTIGVWKRRFPAIGSSMFITKITFQIYLNFLFIFRNAL